MAEIPKTQMQALVRLAEGVGEALVQWGHDMRGIHPIEEVAPDPVAAAVEKFLEAKPEPAAPKPKRTLTPKFTRNEWRSIFMEMAGPTFSVQDIVKKHGPSFKSVRDAIAETDEVVLVSEARPGRGGFPATYKFDPTVGQPKPETNGHAKKTPEELRKRQFVHPLRQAGAKKPSTPHRQMQSLVDEAWDQGWLVTHTGSGHFKFMSPDEEKTVFGPQTPSDYRSFKNARAELRRAGLELA